MTEKIGAYIAIRRRDAYSASHENPIDPRNINMTMEDLGCVFHFDLWKVRQLDDLGQQLHKSQLCDDRSENIAWATLT